jgi:hypothetical protein
VAGVIQHVDKQRAREAVAAEGGAEGEGAAETGRAEAGWGGSAVVGGEGRETAAAAGGVVG